MCGIAGRVTNQSGTDGITSAIEALRHRGPDSHGVWTDHQSCILGHTRLAILDLDQRAGQPMVDASERYVIVFNGEIYNYLDLKSLYLPNFPWKTSSDTEVVVELFSKFGETCLDFLKGMFAFAIWDRQEKSLFLCRDRLGKKPLIYHTGPAGELSFASEINALCKIIRHTPEIFPEAVDLFLGYQFIPAPWTVYRGMYKLPPGHCARWQEGRLSVRQYWNVSSSSSAAPQREAASPEDAERMLESHLVRAVSWRLQADVPVGILLSGGLDSGVVTAIAAQSCKSRLKTFTVGFQEERFNEMPLAEQVAERWSTEHHQLVFSEDQAVEALLSAVDQYGEPFADKSALPSMLVCKAAGRHVKVALNGDGGDEAFGGYPKYHIGDPASTISAGSLNRKYHLGQRVEALRPWFPENGLIDRCLRWLRREGLDPASRIFHQEEFFRLRDRPSLYAKVFSDNLKENLRLRHEQSILDCLTTTQFRMTSLQLLDYRHYLPGDLLVKMDIASMAASLEVRSPFLDQDIVEWALTLPPALKWDGLYGKLLLRRLAERLLPSQLLEQPKRGFSIPVSAWLKGRLRPEMRRLFETQAHPLWQYLQRSALETMAFEHEAGEKRHAHRLWCSLILGLWLERHV